MKIKVNGSTMEIEEGINIICLIKKLNIKNIDSVVIEYNEDILENILFEKTILRENDNLEIVSFVGGG